MTEISATQFKARCLALFDEVAQGGSELVVTKRGRPVARVVPFDQDASLIGSVRELVDEAAVIAPLGEDWDADEPAAD